MVTIDNRYRRKQTHKKPSVPMPHQTVTQWGSFGFTLAAYAPNMLFQVVNYLGRISTGKWLNITSEKIALFNHTILETTLLTHDARLQ